MAAFSGKDYVFALDDHFAVYLFEAEFEKIIAGSVRHNLPGDFRKVEHKRPGEKIAVALAPFFGHNAYARNGGDFVFYQYFRYTDGGVFVIKHKPDAAVERFAENPLGQGVQNFFVVCCLYAEHYKSLLFVAKSEFYTPVLYHSQAIYYKYF